MPWLVRLHNSMYLYMPVASFVVFVITFANRLYTYQARQKVEPNLDANCLTLWAFLNVLEKLLFDKKKLEMCQCGTDAPAGGHCLREKVFIQDGMYGDKTYVRDGTDKGDAIFPLKIVGRRQDIMRKVSSIQT